MSRPIQVLLATYNGAAHVEQQLDSLRRQTVADQMTVLVRDDASTDGTVAVVRDFDPGPLALELIPGDHLGAAASFLDLLRRADLSCPTTMLCDQDDHWDPDKAEIAAAALAGLDPGRPGLYCCRSVVTDAQLNPVGLTDLAPRGPSFRNSLVQIIASGHTMALNPRLVELARQTMDPAAAVMHDNWIYCLAAGLGQVVFDPEPHVRYRIHSGNEMGFTVGWRRELERLGRLLRSDRSQLTRQARALAQVIGDDLAEADRSALLGFIDQSSLAQRLSYLARFPLVLQRRSTALASTWSYLVGRFRPAD
ncbi:MAG: glycosyltransferase [Propionibacteriaceae bacterium]|jgi:glycosyltransferase involved in cell wall biosynthesis|nr:glycosyltransferase [Propionibacteriaceae bacterium]